MQQRNILSVFLILLLLFLGGAILWQSFQQKNQPVDVFTTPMDTISQVEADMSSPTSVADAIPVEMMDQSDALESAKEITVMAKNFSFTDNEIRVKAGQKVILTLQNDEGFHDLVIDEFDVATRQIAAGQKDTVEFTPLEPGEYEFYCSVGDHRAMGMVGTLIVE